MKGDDYYINENYFGVRIGQKADFYKGMGFRESGYPSD